MALVCRPRAYAGTSSVLQPRGRRYAKVRLKLLLQMSLQRLVHAGLVAKRPRANCSSLMVVGFAVLDRALGRDLKIEFDRVQIRSERSSEYGRGGGPRVGNGLVLPVNSSARSLNNVSMFLVEMALPGT